MDGKNTSLRHLISGGRWLFIVTICTPTVCVILCAIGFEFSPRARSADRPLGLRRTFFRTPSNTAEKSEVPPSPVSTTNVNESTTWVKPVSGTPVTSLLPGSEVANDSKSLRRFPKKMTPLANNERSLLSDVDLGIDQAVTPIDLPAALQLAGWESPEVLLAQQRVLAVTARQQLAAAQALPNLNIGTNYDSHTGALQRASGLILQVQRSALYVGAGGNAVAAGTVNIPGLQYNLNVGEAYFAHLVSRQQSERSRAAAIAARNNVLLQVAVAYCRLVHEQGKRAIAVKIRDDASEVARITEAFATAGQGRPADAERAATEVGIRSAEILAADAAIVEASARLGQILNLESSVRLQSSENWIVPRAIVPDLIPLAELIAISLYQRPEIAERRAEVHAAMLELDNARLLIFSPQFIAGFSDGAFGGGSDVNTAATGSPRFGDFGNRTDADIILYWSIRNLGLANKGLIKAATARLAVTDFERTKRLNDIRAEVASAFARTQSSAAQLDVRERAVKSSERGFREDLQRAIAGEGRPIEVLDSLRLRARAQKEYLETIATYNEAQYQLYVAIGQPPADLLVHTASPTESADQEPEAQ